MIENIDMKPVEGLRSVGASYVGEIRFAAVPQVLANFASYTLLRFEINVRERDRARLRRRRRHRPGPDGGIRKFYYSDVSAMLVMIIAVVMTIDISTQYLRRGADGRGAPVMTRALAQASTSRRCARAIRTSSSTIGGAATAWRRHRERWRALRRRLHLFRRPVGAPWSGLDAARLVRRGDVSADAGRASVTYLNALGETLAISWLGTLTGGGVRVAARHSCGAQRIPTAWIHCRSSGSSTPCAASTR